MLARQRSSTLCGYMLNNLLEHGRAADDTTFGVQLFAAANVTVLGVLKRNVRTT